MTECEQRETSSPKIGRICSLLFLVHVLFQEHECIDIVWLQTCPILGDDVTCCGEHPLWRHACCRYAHQCHCKARQKGVAELMFFPPFQGMLAGTKSLLRFVAQNLIVHSINGRCRGLYFCDITVSIFSQQAIKQICFLFTWFFNFFDLNFIFFWIISLYIDRRFTQNKTKFCKTNILGNKRTN